MLSRVATSPTGSGYRYGFNGKEDDNGAKGSFEPSSQEQLDYGKRIYDPRVGRFLSIDPISKKYPSFAPYHYASNSPIAMVDIDGLEGSMGISGSACIIGSTTEFDVNGDHIPDWNEGGAGAMLFGLGGGTAITADIFLTGGKVSQLLFVYTPLASAFEHNRATTAEGKKEQDRRSWENLINAGSAWGWGRLFARASLMLKGSQEILYNFGAKALGEMGEEALARDFGTTKPTGKGSSMKTSFGVRKPDGIPAGTQISTTDKYLEAKVGFQEYSEDIAKQVDKDEELLKTGQVNKVTWVFYKSPGTGKVGGSEELLKALKRAGIKTVIQGAIPKDILAKYIIKYAPTTK